MKYSFSGNRDWLDLIHPKEYVSYYFHLTRDVEPVFYLHLREETMSALIFVLLHVITIG